MVASKDQENDSIVLTLINKHLYNEISINLPESLMSTYKFVSGSTIAPDDVRSINTFEKPDMIQDAPLTFKRNSLNLPKHSVSKIVLQKR